MIKQGVISISKAYLGLTSIKKIMMGNSIVFETPLVEEGNTLPGMTLMDLPYEHWTETLPNAWQQILTTNEDAISLDYLMEGDGAMFFKYISDGYSKTPDMMLFDMPTLQSGVQVVDLWIQDGVFYWEDPHGGVQSELAVNGNYYGLTRTNGVVKIMKSNDGINISEITQLAGNREDLIYLQSWWHSSTLNKLYYPQGAGLKEIYLLKDAVKLNLPSFTKNGRMYKSANSGTFTIAEMGADSFVASRYESTSDSFFYITNIDDSVFYGYYFYANQLFIESVDEGEFLASVQPELRQYIVMRKVSNNLSLELTLDGVSFTLIHNYGVVTSDILNLITVGSNTIYDPQGHGLTII